LINFDHILEENGPFCGAGVQEMFCFPIKDLIRSDVTDQVKIVTKSEGTCNRIEPTPLGYSKLSL